jgi:uncharacterized protein YdaU (DUF1376 family)
MHYYQFHIGDYQRDTMHLDEMEDLAYRRLLDLYYKEEQPIPDDMDRVAKLIRMRTHSECIASVLREYFELTENGWVNHRAQKFLQEKYAKSESARRAAEERWARSSAKKGNKSKEKQRVNANAMRTHSERNADGMHEPCESDAKPMLPTTHYPLPTTQEKSMSSQANDVSAIFEYWRTKMGKNGSTRLSTKRRRSIEARLKEGRTGSDILKAIDGCAMSPFHMGQGPRSDGTIYNDIELICRNNEKLEQFMGIFDSPPQQNGGGKQFGIRDVYEADDWLNTIDQQEAIEHDKQE